MTSEATLAAAQEHVRGAHDDEWEFLPHSGRRESLGLETVGLDEAMAGHVGEMGRHQLLLFCLVSFTWLPGALLVLDMAFIGGFLCL
jgi:hypothetical protein